MPVPSAPGPNVVAQRCSCHDIRLVRALRGKEERFSRSARALRWACGKGHPQPLTDGALRGDSSLPGQSSYLRVLARTAELPAGRAARVERAVPMTAPRIPQRVRIGRRLPPTARRAVELRRTSPTARARVARHALDPRVSRTVIRVPEMPRRAGRNRPAAAPAHCEACVDLAGEAPAQRPMLAAVPFSMTARHRSAAS